MTTLVPRRDDFFFPLEQTFNQLFDNFFNTKPLNALKGTVGFPKMNIYINKEDELVIVAAVAGLSAEDLSIEVKKDGTGNYLVLSGKMSSEYNAPSNSQELIRELRMSTFERVITLPDSVVGDPDAVLKDGVLTLRWQLPKKSQESDSRKIAIRSG